MKFRGSLLISLLAVGGGGFLTASISRGGEVPDRALTLPEALGLAARLSERVGVAAERIERARAIRRGAYATLLPTLTASGTYTRRSREVTRRINDEDVVVSALNALNGVATADLTLFNARAFPVAKSTDRSLQAQIHESEETRRALAFEVAESFFAVLSAERLREAADHRIELAEAVVGDARTRLDAGLASGNELTRSELELASARLARTQAQNAVETTRLALSFLVGLEVDGPLADPPAEPVPAGEIAAAAEDRPDLKAAKLRAEAARLLAQEPGMRLFPTLGLRGTYRGTNEPGLNGRETDWNIAATLTWVLFDGGIRYADARARAAEFREAMFNADALRRRIALEVRMAQSDFETAQAALQQATVRSRVAEQNAEEVRVRFGEGLATALEQADAIVSAFEAEAGLARQGFALRVAQLSLARSLGRWPEAGTRTDGMGPANPPAAPAPAETAP